MTLRLNPVYDKKRRQNQTNGRQHMQTDRHTDRHLDRQVGRQRQADRQTYIGIGKQADRQ